MIELFKNQVLLCIYVIFIMACIYFLYRGIIVTVKDFISFLEQIQRMKNIKILSQNNTDTLKENTINQVPSSVINKVIGIGGGGCNITEYITHKNPNSYDSLIIDNDKNELYSKNISNKILLNKGDDYGCVSNEECGYKLVKDGVITKLKEFTGASNEVFIIATLGGSNGSISTKAIIENLAKSNVKINLIVTYPFSWEGEKRQKKAQDTIEFVSKYIINLYEYHNDQVIKDMPIKQCLNILSDIIDNNIRKTA